MFRFFALTLNAPIATKFVCFSRLLKCLRSLYEKQCGPRSDCSYRSSLFWVHAVCFYTYFVSNVRQLFAADDFGRRHFQMHFFLGSLRVNPCPAVTCDFQQCGILTSVDSDEPVQPPFNHRNTKCSLQP